MNDPGSPTSPEVVLERGLVQHLDPSLGVVAIDHRPLDGFSVNPIARLSVLLSNGRELPVIFKRLRPQPGRDVRREVLLYERLLAGRCLGTPLLYASLIDDDRGIYWLFLEDVGDWRLDWCESKEWFTAFRWLARMHATNHGRELKRLGCLGEHGRNFYLGLAVGAFDELERRGRADARARLEGVLEPTFESTIFHLARQPKTLVHGDLSCHNLMVQPGLGIRPVDWEWAAIGVGAWDLGKLLSGWGSRKPVFVSTYVREFDRHAPEPLDPRTLGITLAHCDVLKILWYLQWWVDGCDDPAFVDRLIDKIEQTYHRLLSRDFGPR